jgi:hypothetical protein
LYLDIGKTTWARHAFTDTSSYLNRLSDIDTAAVAAAYLEDLNAHPSLRFRLAFSESGTWRPRNDEKSVGPLIGKHIFVLKTQYIGISVYHIISYHIISYHIISYHIVS